VRITTPCSTAATRPPSWCHRHPDGYGLYHNEGEFHGFFLEYDRGTMNRRDYVKKFSAYDDYAITRHFERDYHGYPTILIVTTSNGTEERKVYVERAAGVDRSVALPILLTCQWRVVDPANIDGLPGQIWRTPDAEFGDLLCWLPASAAGPRGTFVTHSATNQNTLLLPIVAMEGVL
jgi:hypothetical protein